MVFVTTTPSTFGEVYGAAVAQGFEAKWSGAGPTYNPVFIGPDSPIADPIQRDWYGAFYSTPWASESAGMALVQQLYAESGSEEPLKDYVTVGVVEAYVDMTDRQAVTEATFGRFALGQEIFDVVEIARGQIVHADDSMTLLQERAAEVAADEAGATGDHDVHAGTSSS